MVVGVRKKSQKINLAMPNNIPSMKYSLKSAPGLADVGVLHGVGDGPRAPTRWLEGSGKKSQMTNLTKLNKISSMKYSLKSVSGFAHVGVLHAVGDGPRAPPRWLEGSGKSLK